MPPKSSGGGKKSKAAKQVTNKRRRGFVDPDLKVSKRQAKKDDAKFVKAKFGNFKPEKEKQGRDAAAAADSDSSDDEDARNALGRKPPRQRTHVFKNFAARVSEVDVDVHRTMGELRTAPLAGSSCFYHESLVKWAELNCGADFSALKAETEQLCQSLPQLVLHQNEILDAILRRLTYDAKVSLEAILACLQALARDLRGDFLPHFGKTADALSDLARSEAAREPELLEHVFACLARICKWLQRQLAADLPRALTLTRTLRRHRAAHVRRFAAQATAFLLRAAPDGAVAAGVDALLDEATAATETVRVGADEGADEGADGAEGAEVRTETRALANRAVDDNVDAAGALVAEATKGAAHGLHSRATRVLRRVFRPRGVGFEPEERRARVARAYRVAEVAVDALAKHVRRGKCAEMWRLALSAARRATRDVDEKSDAMRSSGSESDDSESEDVSLSSFRAARAVSVVAAAVEVYNGARVEAYGPIFELVSDHALPALARASRSTSVSSEDVGELATATHRLCLAVVAAHDKRAGASEGPDAAATAAGSWESAVVHAPPATVFAFLGTLRERAMDGSAAATGALFAALPAAAPALTRLLDVGWDADAADEPSVVDADAAAMLLGDVCDVLRERFGANDDEAMIAAASPAAAAAVVARCRRDEKDDKKRRRIKTKKGKSSQTGVPARRRWALLRVLPHCARGEEAKAATEDAIAWSLGILERDACDGYAAAEDPIRDASAVLGAALAARTSGGADEEGGADHEGGADDTDAAALAIRAARCAKDCATAVSAAAALLRREPGRVPPDALRTALETHAHALQSPSRHLRAATLEFLCALAEATGECPPLDECSTSETPGSLGEIFFRWLEINRRDASDASLGGVMEYAKKSQVAMASMTRMVEQGDRVEAWWAAPMARCALGGFHARLATLWPEMIKHIGALAAVKERDSAWDALFRELTDTQRECLDAHDAAAAAVSAGADRKKWKDGGESRRARLADTSPAEALTRRVSAEAFPNESGTERWTRVGLLIRAATASKSAASRHPAPLARLFLAFDSPKPDGTRRAGKAWRAGLREWLKLMKDALTGGRQVRGLENGVGDAVRASLERHVSADEPDLARLSLKCLGQWRMPHLTPENADRLCRVADVATMKDELTTLHVEDGGEGIVAAVRPEHRFAFASLVVRCLLPRLKRRSGRYAPLRAAALSWIGRLDAREITPLVYAAVGPLEPVAAGIEGEWADALVATASGDATARAAWLEMARDARVGNLVREGSRRPAGYLRAAGDLLKAMGEHVGTYLDPILALALVLLETSSELCEAAAAAREAAKEEGAMDHDAREEEEKEEERDEDEDEDDDEDDEDDEKKNEDSAAADDDVNAPTSASREAKEVRTLAVRLVASIFSRHPSFDYAAYWPLIASALEPMAARMAAESSATAPPPALAVVAALAADERLAVLLTANEGGSKAANLVAEAWRALGAPRASPVSRAAALDVAESLIEQAENATFAARRGEREDDDEHVSSVLLREHAPTLLEALQSALAARASRGREERKPAAAAAGAAGRELAVLKRLGPLLGGAAASAAIADTLVPVLAIRRLDEAATTEVLQALAAVTPPAEATLDPERARDAANAADRHRRALAPLFGRLWQRAARRALVDAFEVIGARDDAARAAAGILADLHADARDSIDGVDYDRRMRAYETLDAAWFASNPPAAAVPLLHHVMHELRGSDMALRHAAAAALERFLDAAVASESGRGGVQESLGEGPREDTEHSDDEEIEEIEEHSAAGKMVTAASRAENAARASESSLAGAVMGVLAPGVRGLLRSPESATRGEAIAAFRRLALAWPSAAPGARRLADESDPEQDFFANMAHLQAHRRCRALRRLAGAAKSGEVPPATINGYLAPLAVASLGDAGADVASTAAATIGGLACALPWESYRDLLMWMLRKAGGGRGGRDGRGYDVEGSKALHIRAAATVLENFHEWDEAAEDAMEEEEGQATATNVVGRLIDPVVVTTLRQDVLPHLERLTVVEDDEGKGGTVRPAASAAVTSLLRLLPARNLETDIGRVLGKIANCLRSRAQGVRDSARAALAAASSGLGAAHLPRVVGLLTGRLDRGFMTHVLGAALHSLLEACVPGADPEDVEDALDEIMPIIDADVFGRAAEEREVEAIRGAYKEARRSRAHECLTLLAANAACPSALPELLAPVTRRLHAADAPGLKKKLEGCLTAVQKGVLHNPHASPEETLVLVHSVVNDGVSKEEREREDAEAPKLQEMTLGMAKKGQKETGNRVWDNGWCEDERRPARRAHPKPRNPTAATPRSASFSILRAQSILRTDRGFHARLTSLTR